MVLWPVNSSYVHMTKNKLGNNFLKEFIQKKIIEAIFFRFPLFWVKPYFFEHFLEKQLFWVLFLVLFWALFWEIFWVSYLGLITFLSTFLSNVSLSPLLSTFLSTFLSNVLLSTFLSTILCCFLRLKGLWNLYALALGVEEFILLAWDEDAFFYQHREWLLVSF